MTEINTVLVLGATGKTGRRLVAKLADRGAVVRAASRHPGADGVLFDWDRPETHGPALAGADAVYVVLPEMVADPSPVAGPFLALATAAGVRRVVLLTALGPGLDQVATPGFGLVEDQLRASGLDWTILRPTGFFQNFSEGIHLAGIREQGVVAVPTGDGRAPLVDAEDIAAVAAAALTEDGHAKAAYAVTGPAAITYGEAAELVGAVSGRVVVHQDVPREEFVGDLLRFGLPPDYAQLVVGTFDAVREGRGAAVSPHVEQVTGRPATSFADFVTREASAWG